MQMGIKDTIGNIFVPPPPPPPVTVVEGAENFRLLGVPPNAEYDEVQQAVKQLKEKYAGDTKRLLKIDVAKDKHQFEITESDEERIAEDEERLERAGTGLNSIEFNI